MIKKLQLKLIAIMMGVLLLVFAVVFATLNIFMYVGSYRQTKEFLKTVASEGGIVFPPRDMPSGKAPQNIPPPRDDPEIMRAGRFFYVKVNEGGDVIETHYDMMLDFTRDEAVGYAKSVLDGGRQEGTMDHLQYLVASKSYGKIIVFAQRSIETRMLSELTYISVWAAAGTCLVLLGVSVFLSKCAVNPVKTAFEKQRRFISDAGHELKTPLTIISANADVLKSEIGANERVSHIKAQTERMSLLIHDLLTLAKADEGGAQIIPAKFNLSRSLLNTTLEFESRAFEEEKRLDYDIGDGILYTGDEQRIKALASILIDNAIRHSNEAGKIKVTLFKENGKIRFCVYNTGAGIDEGERDKIFDRFYRSDHSRSRETGGYGLGLSIAKSIADAHKGKITVTGKSGEWVQFTVTL